MDPETAIKIYACLESNVIRRNAVLHHNLRLISPFYLYWFLIVGLAVCFCLRAGVTQ